jgi:hypothetical protein
MKAVDVIELIKPYLVLERRIKSAEKIVSFFRQCVFAPRKRWTDEMRQEGFALHGELRSNTKTKEVKTSSDAERA